MSKLWRRGGASGAAEGSEPGEELELSGHGHGGHKKKHKKHKKKHKKKQHQEEGPGPPLPSTASGPAQAPAQLKLRIKLGGQVLGTKSVPTFTVIPEEPRSPSPLMVVDNEEEPMEGVPIEQYRAWLDEDSNLSPSPLGELAGGLGGREDEEEQRWLDALEKGELDDNGDLKKEINERLLTARQRALLQKARSQPSPMLALPAATGTPALTEEMLMKREERARKRRLQAARRAEEHKNQTIERLTKTAAPSSRGGRGGVRGERRGGRPPAATPMVRYSSGVRGATLSFPVGVPTPAPASPPPPPPGPRPRCSVPGCPHPRRYACSRTGQPLCSLQCYRINLQLLLGLPEGAGAAPPGPLVAT
ncbi:INO80 complex subunit B [Phascolarctos cinereus]|uniref:INO80 complex subunit B n=1 Tax=Phascolarctos cinereus TaxID=38626 RepID=A0A6P5LRC5_PHACI|nr:INO80 complex subunit B [Phascolarctos cinereus]XP_020861002.1 INO80 complex subunit B [Phascolarctos cinereus]